MTQHDDTLSSISFFLCLTVIPPFFVTIPSLKLRQYYRHISLLLCTWGIHWQRKNMLKSRFPPPSVSNLAQEDTWSENVQNYALRLLAARGNPWGIHLLSWYNTIISMYSFTSPPYSLSMDATCAMVNFRPSHLKQKETSSEIIWYIT